MPLTAAETHEVTQLETANRKIYVLDTNVLLHDPTAVTAFAEHHVVIPMTVLEELDHIKDRRDKSVSREARIAIQLPMTLRCLSSIPTKIRQTTTASSTWPCG